jgi:hypothetical protein
MAKLQLKAAPTFQAEVGIRDADGNVTPVKMTFRHRTKTELDEFIKARPDKTDVESFMDMVVGWDLEEELNEANVTTLMDNYMGGAALPTFQKYIDALLQARLGN